MIKKPRPKPLKVPFCEALEQRIDPNHPKLPTIKNDLGSYSSGYHGEKSLDYHLSTLSQKRYLIFHGLRLKNDQYHFQIDTLILTSHYTFILEAKNYSGTIFLDTPLNQLIQTKGDSTEVYPCPILQAERQQYELQNWLQSCGLANLPVENIVVFANKKGLLKTHPDHQQIYQKICKSPDIKNRIEKVDRLHPEEQLNEKALKKLAKTLINSHVSIWSHTMLAEYKMATSEILTGVQCPSCGKLGMHYHKQNWICPLCHTCSKTAHEKAIRDYFLLIKPTITNKELRRFLHLPNARIAQRLLLSLNLRFSGDKKTRVYHVPKEYPFYG
ncbi:nuclease-related domain-containing protein [Neobacillus sp. D3-1R]|uniref:nuclease-related domain-containing protein n=1 Tax=Neobacillus sp. D3-1R TaxID=3445778 RepID=UPI003FA095CF